ncbi:hypothetical protein GCM10011383_36620 [Hymenobacter cavernae]|uniref:T9SS C-terminal target domain-containing protein n=1 Tax=Hymenobacter cavernae TaxID=2044852 RepID=A0ABQ1UL20_9BACT|nr:hypothetical protein GCM10011383_36620 [Hymenobacter cavernae]
MFLLIGAAQAQTPTVTSISPARNTYSVPRNKTVEVNFSQSLYLEDANSQILKIFSAQTGYVKTGAIGTSNNTVKFVPGAGFRPGETISATITTAARSSSGQKLAKPLVFQFTTATSPSKGVFGGDADPGIGNNATSATLGDVDGDGDLDMLVANYNNEGTVSVQLNNGKGTFSSKGHEVRVGAGPYQVVLGDVDGDGDLDLLTPNANTAVSTVSVRLNDGKGNFGGTQEVPTGENPHALALGDIDGDGDLDLLAANYVDSKSNFVTSTVSVRLNDGTGKFSAVGQEVTVGTRPISIALGDIDNDGDLDFVTANSNTVTSSVRLNDGLGSFSGSQEVVVGTNPHSVVLGDIDGDGDLDLVTGDLNSSTASLRLNNGQGTFSGDKVVDITSGARSVALNDIDGDGDLDLLAPNYTANTVSVRLNNGAGAFSGKQEVSIGAGSYSIALGDLDNDGDLDLVTVNNTSNTVSVRFNESETKKLEEEISVFPNPAHLKAQLQFPPRFAEQLVQVRIVDMVGRTMSDQQVTTQQIATQPLMLHNLATGVYHLRLDTSEGSIVKRLIVE